jgi:RNA recognition motif-containing protein
MTTKVFVGNLAFQTTDQALAEAFQDCGRVKSGVVITRGRRSLGYGFVEFEAPESALEAVKSKNNSQLKGRTLKVELASDNPIRMDRNPPGPSGPSGPPPASSNSPSDQPPGNAGGPRRRRRNNRRRRTDSNKPSGPETSNPPSTNPSTVKPSGPGGENPRDRDRSQNNRSRGEGPIRRRNQPPNNDDRVLSKTAVFVANLPFGVKDEELLLFFKDNNAKSAHVVVTRNGRSRGYGFVDFELEKDQQNAINTKHNVKFSERIITVTPSYKTQEVIPEN